MYTILDSKGVVKGSISNYTVKKILQDKNVCVKLFKNMGRDYIRVIYKFDFEWGFLKFKCYPNYFIREEL